jgi:hypothetical protein
MTKDGKASGMLSCRYLFATVLLESALAGDKAGDIERIHEKEACYL